MIEWKYIKINVCDFCAKHRKMLLAKDIFLKNDFPETILRRNKSSRNIAYCSNKTISQIQSRIYSFQTWSMICLTAALVKPFAALLSIMLIW
jgi:hypothetical protein